MWQSSTNAIEIPKLPFVSYSRILGMPGSFKLQTCTLPLILLLAKYDPSALSAIAQASPALSPSVESQNGDPTTARVKVSPDGDVSSLSVHSPGNLPLISPSAAHWPSSPSLHIFTLPSKPALAARRASFAVARW